MFSSSHIPKPPNMCISIILVLALKLIGELVKAMLNVYPTAKALEDAF